MNLRRIPALAALMALALSTGGCMMRAWSLDTARVSIEEQLPGASFDPEFQLTLGRISLGLARKLVNMLEKEDQEELRILRSIRRVEVAVYSTESLPSVRPAAFTIPHERRLKKKGWQTMTRVVSDDSATWVLYLEDKGDIKALMVGALDDDELVLVKLNGDIQGIFEQLVEEGILDVPGVVHADLEPEPGEPIAHVDSE